MPLQQREYINRLKSAGYDMIGNGLYSNVFAIPNTDKVIKVAEMDRWPEYILWATRKGYAGTYAPKVYSLKFYDGYYVAIMERLVCTIGNLSYADSAAGCGHACNSLAVRLFHHVTSWEPLAENTERLGGEGLLEFLDELRDASLYNDLHTGNAMLRKDGQLVVIDPVAGRFTSDKFRIKNGTANCS